MRIREPYVVGDFTAVDSDATPPKLEPRRRAARRVGP